MARGITESDVHTAADELVAAGERPTVERIRAHLGTGSPNTVTRWLETWWRGLGRRLQVEQIRLAIPDAPETVTALAGEWWGLALAAAREQIQQDLATERGMIEASRLAVSQERTALEAEAASLRQVATAAAQAERIATAQVTELLRQVDGLVEQLRDIGQQRDAAQSRGDRLEEEFLALARRLEEQQAAAAHEREMQAERILAMENRAHMEVDRARQEAKELRTQMGTALAALEAKEVVLQRQRDEALAACGSAQRETAAAHARAQTLEQQIAQLLESSASERPKARKLPITKQRAPKRPERERRQKGD